MKKIAFLLALILMFTMLSTPTHAAAINQEIESNDTANTATSIDAGVIEGSLSSENDVDYYRFDANQDYFTVSFGVSSKNLGADAHEGWNVYIYDSKMTLINSFATTSSHSTVRFSISGIIYIKVLATSTAFDNEPTNVIYEISYTTAEDSYWESEYNDNSTSANTISANKTYTGSLHTDDDTDWFKVTSKDYFTVTLSQNIILENVNSVDEGWCVTIYDSSKTELSSFSTTTSNTSIKYPLSGTIYVKITANSTAFDYEPKNVYYDLIVNTSTDSKWENEYNNSSTKANTITQSTTYHGNLHVKGDVDYFKVKSTTSAIAVKFTVSLDEVEPEMVQNGWKITVYAQDSAKSLASYTVNAIGSFNSIALPYAKGKYYYVKVEAQSTSFDNAPVNVPYHIAIVDASEGKTWEVENGKTSVSSATSLAESKTIYGNLYQSGDMDYYKCSILSAGSIKVNFKRDNADNDGDGYAIKVIDAGGKTIASKTVEQKTSGTLSGVSVSKGTYYIVVNKAGYTAPGADINYNISYALTLKKPAIKSVSPTTNTFKVAWAKRSDVNGYQVQYATNKNFTGAKTLTAKSSSTGVTIKSTSAKSVYYVRMRVVVKDGSTNRYSAWSSTKVAINTPKVSKVTAPNKNSLKVTWIKNSGATGYQIQYSTNKKFNAAKKVTAKSSATSAIIKNTSAKTTYYVRIRTVSGSTYSPWSSAYTIKTK